MSQWLVEHWQAVLTASLGWLAFIISFWRLMVSRGQLRTTKGQLGIAQRQLDLSIHKATPRLGSTVEIRPVRIEGRADVRRQAIYTKIYNDGDLVARNVEGKWKYSASHGMYSEDKVINRESLPTSNPWEHQLNLPGNFLASLRNVPNATIQVDIDLEFSGLDEKKRERYRAMYRYDHKEQSMVRVKDSEKS